MAKLKKNLMIGIFALALILLSNLTSALSCSDVGATPNGICSVMNDNNPITSGLNTASDYRPVLSDSLLLTYEVGFVLLFFIVIFTIISLITIGIVRIAKNL